MLSDLATVILLTLLLISAIAVAMIRDLLWAVIVFGVYSVILTLLWQQLNAPDIAITEAAAGIGMTAIMVAVITRIGREEG